MAVVLQGKFDIRSSMRIVVKSTGIARRGAVEIEADASAGGRRAAVHTGRRNGIDTNADADVDVDAGIDAEPKRSVQTAEAEAEAEAEAWGGQRQQCERAEFGAQ